MVDALKKKQTIPSTALRLGTFRLVFFSGSFFPYSWHGQWNNRPLGSVDMSSPLETLVREVIGTAVKNKPSIKKTPHVSSKQNGARFEHTFTRFALV